MSFNKETRKAGIQEIEDGRKSGLKIILSWFLGFLIKICLLPAPRSSANSAVKILWSTRHQALRRLCEARFFTVFDRL